MQKIEPKEAKQNLEANPEIVLLDVREASEYEEGYIPHAINIGVNQLYHTIEEVVKDKNQTIYVYCHSGIRSAMACDLLEEMGYTDLYDLGGIIFWPYDIVK